MQQSVKMASEFANEVNLRGELAPGVVMATQ